MKFRLFLWLIPLVLVTACQENLDVSEEEEVASIDESRTLFSCLTDKETGITFSNTLSENDTLNIILYDYLYNGSGVAVIDVNNDGLEDVFFAGNQVQDELYLNKGNLQFENATSQMGFDSSNGWSTGVIPVDVNQDGWMDLYVCKSGPAKAPAERTNQLFINQGGESFIEDARSYGLDYAGHTSTAAFFDADRDGDLDCYLLTHPGSFQKKVNLASYSEQVKAGLIESDVFLENRDGKFQNVSEKVGIADGAYGLGLAIEDVNLDGWPDIYVSNDFDEGDLLYINNEGTFTNEINTYLKHTSNYGMGCDIADFNNDLWPDVFTTDMAFTTHERSKRNMASMDEDLFNARVQIGWHYQYMANTLQLNNGDGTFSDLAQLSGIHKTDWSWSGLIADLDLDGLQDIFVSNGYKRDTKDNDLKNNVQSMIQEKGSFSVQDVLAVMPSEKIENVLFRNRDGYSFERANDEWGMPEKVTTHGAAYADLDNDGDFELIVNNQDSESAIYENTSTTKNWIAFEIDEATKEGSRIRVLTENRSQMRYCQPSRGYLSSSTTRLYFGLGEEEVVLWAELLGADGSVRRLENTTINQIHSISFGGVSSDQYAPDRDSLFVGKTAIPGLVYTHQEVAFDEFALEILKPHKHSTEGPAMAKADVNKDGLDDLWIGGGAGQAAKLFIQQENGAFLDKETKLFVKEAAGEDIDAVWFDADGDEDLDLYVVRGSSEFSPQSEELRDRLYLNDGQGNLSFGSNRIPAIKRNGAAVVAIDVDSDGDEDLIVGNHSIPGQYPKSEASVVLKNERGLFSDVTDEMAPSFTQLGMVTSLEATDLNGDGIEDVIVAGEFMAPTCFVNKEGVLMEKEVFPSGLEGWWQNVTAIDVDNDGDQDLILGNIGENNKFHPTPENPLRCYANDFDGNGSLDIVLAKNEGDALYPVRGKECSSQQMPFIAQKFKTFKSFAQSDLEGIYSQEKLNSSLQLTASTFQSVLAINNGDGTFEMKHLPVQAQFAPIRTVVCADLNEDGYNDLICAGNFFATEVETTRYDAGNGIVLLGNGTGTYEGRIGTQTGLSLPYDTRDMQLIQVGGEDYLIAVNSNGPALIHKIKPQKPAEE